jgi:hypothetical protein
MPLYTLPCPCGYRASAQSERAVAEAFAAHYVAVHVPGQQAAVKP